MSDVPTIDNRVPKGEYHISFDTRGTPGFMRAVKITIEVDMLPDDTAGPGDLQAKYAVNLCDHPMYQHLRRYCLANEG